MPIKNCQIQSAEDFIKTFKITNKRVFRGVNPNTGEKIKNNDEVNDLLIQSLSKLGETYTISDNDMINQIVKLIQPTFEKLLGASAPSNSKLIDIITSYNKNVKDITTQDSASDEKLSNPIANESKERQQKFNYDYMGQAYGSSIKARNEAIKFGERVILNSSIFKIDNEGNRIGIIQNDGELNDSIRNQQERLFQTVVDYLNSKGKLSRFKFPITMYDDKGNYTGNVEKVANYAQILEHDPKNVGNVLDLLLSRSSNPAYPDAVKELQAYNAWTLLKNYDKFIKNQFGTSINVNEDFPLYTGKPKYSMSLLGSNVNTQHRQSEDIWLDKETSNIVQLIIRNIPYLSYGIDSQLNNISGKKQYIKYNEFAYAIGKIKDLYFNLKKDYIFNRGDLVNFGLDSETIDKLEGLSLKKDILSNLDNPQKSSKLLFEILGNPQLFELLESQAFKDEYFIDVDKNIIYSIYKGVFDSKNPESLYSINSLSGFDNINYYSWLTQNIASIYNIKYLQYYRDEKGRIRVRNMYDQGINNIRRTITQTVNTINSTLIGNYQQKVKTYNITENYKDIFNGAKIIDPNFYGKSFTIKDFNNGKIKGNIQISISSTGELTYYITSNKISHIDSRIVYDPRVEPQEKPQLALLPKELSNKMISWNDIKSYLSPLESIEYIIPKYNNIDDLTVKVYVNGNINYSTQGGSQVVFDKNSWNNLVGTKLTGGGFIESILKQNLYLNEPYQSALFTQYGKQSLGIVIQDLMNLCSRVLLNECVANTKINNLSDYSEITTKLVSIYGENHPTIDSRTQELKLTTDKDESTIVRLAQAKAFADGLLTSSQIKDGNGNSVSSNRLSCLLGSYPIQFESQNKNKNSASKDFLLLKNGFLKYVYNAKELKDVYANTSKSSIDWTSSELENSVFVYDWVSGLIQNDKIQTDENHPIGNGVVSFIPSVNADKNNIGRMVVDLNQQVTWIGLNGIQNTRSLKDLVLTEKQIKKRDSNEYFTEQVLNIGGIKELKEISRQQLNPYYERVYSKITKDWQRVNILLGNVISGLTVGNINLAYQNGKLDGKTPLEFIQNLVNAHNYNNPFDIIELIDQVHYVEDSNHFIQMNPTLRALKDRLSSKENIDNFFTIQEKSVLKNLLKDEFEVNIPAESSKDEERSTRFLRGLLQGTWIDSNRDKMILAKISYTDSKGVKHIADICNTLDLQKKFGVDSLDDLKEYTLTLNPLIESYNTINYMVTQEWMSSTVGSHFIHPSKYKEGFFRTTPLSNKEEINLRAKGITSTEIEILKDKIRWNIDYFKNGRQSFLHNYKDEESRKYMLELEDQLLKDEASRYNAQNKRNVAYTAAMQAFQKGTLNGIPDYYNIAIIDDIVDYQSTVNGDQKDGKGLKIKPFDGATFVNPFVVYLENNSLGGAKVGINKKQFVHFYNEETGSGGIIKTAGFGITNDLMRNSIFYQRMMRNMTDRPWYDMYGNLLTNINILQDYNGDNIEYSNPNDQNGERYFKTANGKLYKITSIKSLGNNQYQRTLQEVSKNGTNIGKNITENKIFTVNSNYSLWNLFGGMNCMEKPSGSDVLIESENSIKMVVTAMNKVGLATTQNDVKTQADVYQFLKHSDIHYMPTIGAVKEGAANINPKSAYFEDSQEELGNPSKIGFMKINLNQIGIQLDKEHNADDEDLSMMTQVISACAAKGYTAEEATELYNSLATLADLGISKYMDEFKKFFSNPNDELSKENLQKVIVNTIVDALIHQTNQTDMLSVVTKNLMDKAKEGKDIKFNDIKGIIPYSDKGVFNKLMSIINISLTKASIKIKVPGVLSVLCPSFNIFKLYGDRKLESYSEGELHENQLNLENNQENNISDKLSKVEIGRTYKIFTENPKEVASRLKVNDIKDGYVNYFVQTSIDYRHLREVLDRADTKGLITKVCENIEEGRDLASYNVRFVDSNGDEYQLYDLDSINNLCKLKTNNASTEEIDRTSNLVQEDLKKLSSSDKFGQVNLQVNNGNIIIVDKSDLKIQPYEIIMPKIFATIFDLKPTDNIQDILNNPKFFTEKLLKNFSTHVPESYYNIELKKVNGKHTYILSSEYAKQFTSKNSLESFHKISSSRICILPDNGKFYRVDKNGNKLYELSKSSDELDNGFTTLDSNGKEQTISVNQDEFWEYTNELGQTYEVIVVDDGDGNGLLHYIDSERYNTIHISKRTPLEEALARIKYSKNKSAQKYIKFLNDEEERVQNDTNLKMIINSKITDINTIKKLLENPETITEELLARGITPNVNINILQYINDSLGNNLLNLNLSDNGIFKYINNLGDELFSSFKVSINQIVAARIPAQSMQSFMPMKVAAFDNVDRNTAYVSTSQILLQGSDYDVDSVSLQAVDLDKDGTYVMWSPYSNILTYNNLLASQNLPFPTSKKLQVENEQYIIDNNTKFNYIAYQDIIKQVEHYNKKTKQKELRWEINANTPEKIELLAKLIRKVNSIGKIPDFNSTIIQENGVQKVIGEVSPEFLQQVGKMVDKHNMYIVNTKSSKSIEKLAKNHTVSQIFKIISNPVNLIEAQAPIDLSTKPLAKEAETSPIAQESVRAIPGDFTAAIHAIRENQIGKKGVGIVAVGLKSFFALTDYYNEILNHGTSEQQERLKFNKTIGGKTYNLLANAHSENTKWYREADGKIKILSSSITNKDILEMIFSIQNENDAALTLSALLSLATDNAKELKLAKLNAGTNMLGMYIYGISIGMDFKDISKLMMSPAGFIISGMMSGNSFQNIKAKNIQNIFDYFELGPKNDIFDRSVWIDSKHQYSTDIVWGIIKNKYLENQNKYSSDIISKIKDMDLSSYIVYLAKNPKYNLQTKIKLLEDIKKESLSSFSSPVINNLFDFLEKYLHQYNTVFNSTSDIVEYDKIYPIDETPEYYSLGNYKLKITDSIPYIYKYHNLQNLIENGDYIKESKSKTAVIGILNNSLNKLQQATTLEELQIIDNQTLEDISKVNKSSTLKSFITEYLGQDIINYGGGLTSFKGQLEKDIPNAIQEISQQVKMPYEELPEIVSANKQQALASTSGNKISILKDFTLDYFYNYINGNIPSTTSDQKKKVFNNLANTTILVNGKEIKLTLSNIKNIIGNGQEGLKNTKTLLYYHEKSHIDHNDKDNYWEVDKQGNKNRDLMSPTKINIETRATLDGITQLLANKGFSVSKPISRKISVYPELKKLSEGAEELKTLGQLLHLNQGLPASVTDRINLLNNIESVISTRLYAKYKEDRRNNKKTTLNSEQFNLHYFLYGETDQNGNELRYINNTKKLVSEMSNQELGEAITYRQYIINQYEKVKSTFNILDVITVVPHYLKYLEVLDSAHQQSSIISCKYRAIYNLGSEAISKLKAYSSQDKQAIIKRTQDFIDRYISNRWMLDTNRTIHLNRGDKYFQDGVLTTVENEFGRTIQLGTTDGNATFKYWMDNTVIPRLQDGNIGIGELNEKTGKYPKSISSINQNTFIQALSPLVFSNTPQYITQVSYSLPINMSPRSDAEIELFQNYKASFNDLKGIFAPEYTSGNEKYKICDLLYLYNQIAFQNKQSESALTRIFEDSLDDMNTSSSFKSYVNNMDNNEDIILGTHITIDELLKEVAPLRNPYSTNLSKFYYMDKNNGKMSYWSEADSQGIQIGPDGEEIIGFNNKFNKTQVANTNKENINYYTDSKVSEKSYKINYKDADNEQHVVINATYGIINSIKINDKEFILPTEKELEQLGIENPKQRLQEMKDSIKKLPLIQKFINGNLSKIVDDQQIINNINNIKYPCK